jgi:hypothetical protein
MSLACRQTCDSCVPFEPTNRRRRSPGLLQSPLTHRFVIAKRRVLPTKQSPFPTRRLLRSARSDKMRLCKGRATTPIEDSPAARYNPYYAVRIAAPSSSTKSVERSFYSPRVYSLSGRLRRHGGRTFSQPRMAWDTQIDLPKVLTPKSE